MTSWGWFSHSTFAEGLGVALNSSGWQSRFSYFPTEPLHWLFSLFKIKKKTFSWCVCIFMFVYASERLLPPETRGAGSLERELQVTSFTRVLRAEPGSSANHEVSS